MRFLIISNTGFAIISDIKTLLSQALPPPTYKLQFIFRLLFPQDPLVDCNHSAVIDSLQLAAELAKKPGDRNLPLDLFQGINELPSLYPSAQINILNQYFMVLDPTRLVSNLARRVMIKVEVQRTWSTRSS